MDTPKVKLEKSKANKERKKQIRVYQSTIDKNCGIPLSDAQFAKFNDLLKASLKAETSEMNTEPPEKQDNPSEKPTEDQKPKRSRKETRKTLKSKDLIMGLNEVLKGIPKATIAVICIEADFAANTKAIVHKLASEHRIPTFEGQLSQLKALFNISQLTIVAFHTSTRQAGSQFYPVTQFLFDNLRSPLPKSMKADKEEDEEVREVKAEIEDPIPGIKVPKYDPSVSFRHVGDPQQRYRQRMLEVLAKSLSIADESNCSLINLVDESPHYFPAYSLPRAFELRVEQTLTQGDPERRSHSIAEQIYDFDSQRSQRPQKSSQGNNNNSQQRNSQKRPFLEPKLLKADVPVSQSKKQKKKAGKQTNK